ncbi:response regulator receiver domain [Leptospira santarosai]|uniref:response regulator receiver domain n=1 Tax=Leptospira santarosai TaxID=28183 RepID=UPI00077420AA|nr:response regulator receiver domain [Leptospira santarosai]
MTIDQVKRDITKKYCSSIAVIDDDVFEKQSEYSKIGETFQGLVKKCNEESILCHLHHYPKTQGAPDDPDCRSFFEGAVNAAKSADVTILDWFLGVNDQPNHALKLLEKLSDSESLHFVLIYTAHPEQVVDKLLHFGFESAASSTIENATEEGDDGHEIVTGPPTTDQLENNEIYVKNRRLFVQIKGKDMLSSQIVEAVYAMLLAAYPDLLHWAGLEIAVEIKQLLPKIIGKIPEGSDSALVYQRLHSDVPEEVSSQVSDAFLRELGFNSLMKPLKIVSDSSLESLLPADGIDPEYRSNDTKKRKLAREKINKEAKAEKQVILTTGAKLYEHALHEKWGFIKECFFSYDKEDLLLVRGAILKDRSNDNYFLCSTPSCDLYRLRVEKEDSILFVKGVKKDKLAETKKGSFVQTYVSKDLIIEWDPYDVLRLPINTDIKGYPKINDPILSNYELIGFLKHEFVDRLLHRTWTNQTRVAVDIPELLRSIRNEK